MVLDLRKVVTHTEEVHIEGGRAADPPLRLLGIAAVLTNPWVGQGFVEDLRPTVLEVAPRLGEVLVPRLVDLAGGADSVEGYGKAAMVGTSGEVEHGSALIHTLRFGNVFREAVGGTSYLSFTNTRGGPGATLSIPMMHKVDPGWRSHPTRSWSPLAPRAGADPTTGSATATPTWRRWGWPRSELRDLRHG